MTVISKSLIVSQFTDNVNARVVSVNKTLFKILDQDNVIVVKKVNLEDLFEKQVIPAGKIYNKIDVTDHAAVFEAWAKYFGIDDLSIGDVTLSGDTNTVNVEITSAVVYTGTLILKTK